MSPIRVAISGGGLAGASLLHALLPYTHLDVHIFESAAAFNEAGAAIGMARNTLAALDLIPTASQCLERAGAVPMRGVCAMLAQGEGELVDRTDDSLPGKTRVTSIVHRAAFLRELLAGVPEERMHASKKLETVDQGGADGPLTLRFTDGSTHKCDILIGADGIHSTVRKLILGENDPAASPRNTGWWAVMALKPYAAGQATLGAKFVDIDDAREYMWIGDGASSLHNVLSQGQLLQFIVASRDDTPDAELATRWHRMVSSDVLKKICETWPPNLRKAVHELLCEQPEQPAIYLWEHAPARTYVSGAMCVLGDAAHATTPWQGSGGGMSVEDSLVLSTLLGRAKTVAEARAALRVYDDVRRPRTQSIVESSRATGVIMTGRGENGQDLEKLRGRIFQRWDFIVNFDPKKHRDEAVELLEKVLAASA